MGALAGGSLFTVVPGAGGERYPHHQLFRTFLAQRLGREDPGRLAELHRRAAGAWLASGEPAAAVPHYLQAGEHELAAEALEPLAEEMAQTAEAETLVGWLEAIPEQLRWARPGLVLAEASLLFDRGACEADLGRIERAMEQLLAAGAGLRGGAGPVAGVLPGHHGLTGVGAGRAAAGRRPPRRAPRDVARRRAPRSGCWSRSLTGSAAASSRQARSCARPPTARPRTSRGAAQRRWARSWRGWWPAANRARALRALDGLGREAVARRARRSPSSRV